ncbi:MAG TPA: dienelactone hydrolase family protein, partial [Myxococcota bacterium]
AVVTCYGTGLHKNMLGNVGDVDSLGSAGSIAGELLLVWGRQDPHIPAAGRALIHRRLDEAGVRFEARYFDAAHAFMRDVGERYDPAATDEVVSAAVALFRRRS